MLRLPAKATGRVDQGLFVRNGTSVGNDGNNIRVDDDQYSLLYEGC